MNTIRWGILGPGNIAHSFAKGLTAWDDHQLVAVASRSQEKAEAFSKVFNIENTYSSYDQLVNDKNIDAIYVATPHTFHREHAEMCLQAGKSVLCEKPLCINAKDAQALIDVAQNTQCFLMEAMWSRFLPAMEQAIAWVKSGAIGEPRMLTCDFGFRSEWDPEGRLLNPEFAGGGLLDVGVYTVALSSSVFGHTPVAISAQGHLGKTGVDEQCALLLRYEQGELGILSSAIQTNTPHTARIHGTEGSITLPDFWRATTVTLEQANKEPVTQTFPFIVNGYEYEAREVGKCIREGLLESPRVPHSETLKILKIMDTAREQMGLNYPEEQR